VFRHPQRESPSPVARFAAELHSPSAAVSMTTPQPDVTDAAPPPSSGLVQALGGRLPGRWRLAAAAALVLACGLLGWRGGAWGMGAALAAAVLLPRLLLGRASPAAGGADTSGLDPMLDEPRVSGGRVGAEVMVSQVVPVWGKQLDITRVAAADGLGLLLDGFSQMAGALGTLASQIEHSQVSVAPGAVDAALAPDSPAQAGTAGPCWPPASGPLRQRDAAVAVLVNCGDHAHANCSTLAKQAHAKWPAHAAGGLQRVHRGQPRQPRQRWPQRRIPGRGQRAAHAGHPHGGETGEPHRTRGARLERQRGHASAA
jgi:hypothetical protein